MQSDEAIPEITGSIVLAGVGLNLCWDILGSIIDRSGP